MKKLLIFVFGCLSINMYYSQIESKRILDSISAEKWKKNIPNLDSLAEINLQKNRCKAQRFHYSKNR